MRTLAAVGWSLAAVLLLGSLLWLARLERARPWVDLELAGGIPARLYVPGERGDGFGLPPAPPRGARPPGVVLCHGFSGDRAMMSTLARRLARAGYAVLALDVRGHGANRNRFGGGGRSDHLYPELEAAVDYLRASPRVDGLRLVVMGHSMGAGAVLDYATRDPGLDASVMISGGFGLEGPHRPPNALFIYAENDPEPLRRAGGRLAEQLARGVEGRGDLAAGTAVEVVEVPGHDHLTILYSEDAAREIVSWLDATFELERARPPELSDPRLAAAALGLAAFLVLATAIGSVAGRLAPAWPQEGPEGSLPALAGIAVALVAALPFGASDPLAGVLAQRVTPEVVSFLLAAGLLLLAWLALRGRLGVARLAASTPRSLAVAALVLLAVALVLTPLGVVFHRLVLTPERGAIAVLASLGMLPLFLGLELLLRRGGPVRACAAVLGGKLLVLAVMLAGVMAGLLPGILMLMLPVLAPVLLAMELVAVPLYAGSRNRLAIALVEAGWLGWIQAAVMPTSW